MGEGMIGLMQTRGNTSTVSTNNFQEDLRRRPMRKTQISQEGFFDFKLLVLS
jgi:hypothetical protein